MTFNDKWLLTDLQLHKDGNGYYLSAKYTVDEEHRTKEVSFPKIVLPTCHAPLVLIGSSNMHGNDYIDIGFGELPVGAPPVEKVIKEKVQELTIEEIEKKLGYKVKVVSKEKVHRRDVDCDQCRWKLGHDCSFSIRCKDCPNVVDHKANHSVCKCTTVKHGEPCPYFEEAK